MIRKWFKRVKDMQDITKLILFILALFGTNGLQALFNGSTEDVFEGEVVECAAVVECPEVAEVASVAKVAAVAAVAAIANCNEKVQDHVGEHHGGK